MRATILALPLLLSAAPLYAQTSVPQIPPAAADKVANTLDAVTDAIMSLPVGRLQAAIDGRAPTAAEQQMTVRDLEAPERPGVRNASFTAASPRRGRWPARASGR